MRSKTSIWFEAKYRYEKRMEDGTEKKVTEQYVVEAMSFTEAEAAIAKEMEGSVSGEAEVRALTIAPYSEVLLSDVYDYYKFYKVKVAFITIDEKTEKERKSVNVYLVQAPSVFAVDSCIKDFFARTMIDYEIQDVKETQIMGLVEQAKV